MRLFGEGEVSIREARGSRRRASGCRLGVAVTDSGDIEFSDFGMEMKPRALGRLKPLAKLAAYHSAESCGGRVGWVGGGTWWHRPTLDQV